MASKTPTARTKHRGVTVSWRIRLMLEWVERVVGFAVLLTQGSYNTGVSASAGTHNREAVDVDPHTVDAKGRRRPLTITEKRALDRAMKNAGFIFWWRPTIKGLWNAHGHALPRGGDLAPVAARQVTSFDRGRDGLVSDARDGTYRPNPPVRFDYAAGKPVPLPVLPSARKTKTAATAKK